MNYKELAQLLFANIDKSPDSDEEFVRGGDRIRELAQHYSKVLLLLAPMH